MSTPAQVPVSQPQFPVTSRYYSIATSTLTTADGKTVVYLQRRWLPSPDRFALLQTHLVTQGERLDNISNKFLGDPLAYWRLCDSNGAMRPDELTETIGRTLRITLPEGISLPAHA